MLSVSGIRAYTADKIPEGNVCEGQRGNIAVKEEKNDTESSSQFVW